MLKKSKFSALFVDHCSTVFAVVEVALLLFLLILVNFAVAIRVGALHLFHLFVPLHVLLNSLYSEGSRSK